MRSGAPLRARLAHKKDYVNLDVLPKARLGGALVSKTPPLRNPSPKANLRTPPFASALGRAIFAIRGTQMIEIAPRITVDENVRFGKPVIQGTRIPVALIVGQLAGGMTVEQVMDEYRLEKDDVLACLSYAATVLDDEEVQT